jgi:hypothetical protein
VYKLDNALLDDARPEGVVDRFWCNEAAADSSFKAEERKFIKNYFFRIFVLLNYLQFD